MMAVLIGNLGQFKNELIGLSLIRLLTGLRYEGISRAGILFDAFDFVRCFDKSRDERNKTEI